MSTYGNRYQYTSHPIYDHDRDLSLAEIFFKFSSPNNLSCFCTLQLLLFGTAICRRMYYIFFHSFQFINDIFKKIFFLILGVMLLYLSSIQVFLMAFIYLIPLANATTIIASAILTAFFLSSGYCVHLKDLPAYLKWLQYVSPTSWMLPFLSNRELSQAALKSSSMMSLCRNMQVRGSFDFVHLIFMNIPFCSNYSCVISRIAKHVTQFIWLLTGHTFVLPVFPISFLYLVVYLSIDSFWTQKLHQVFSGFCHT